MVDFEKYGVGVAEREAKNVHVYKANRSDWGHGKGVMDFIHFTIVRTHIVQWAKPQHKRSFNIHVKDVILLLGCSMPVLEDAVETLQDIGHNISVRRHWLTKSKYLYYNC